MFAPSSPEVAAADQYCHLAANNDDNCGNGAVTSDRNGVADDNSIKSASLLATADRMRRRGGSPVTSSLSRRLMMTFAVLMVVTVYCSRVASAVSVASSSTGNLDVDLTDDSQPLSLSSSAGHRRHQLIDLITRLFQQEQRHGYEGRQQLQQQSDSGFDYGPQSGASSLIGVDVLPSDDGAIAMVDGGSAPWNQALESTNAGDGRSGVGRRQRGTAKRGPGVCINSCLTGGMTFVRCKSMCH